MYQNVNSFRALNIPLNTRLILWKVIYRGKCLFTAPNENSQLVFRTLLSLLYCCQMKKTLEMGQMMSFRFQHIRECGNWKLPFTTKTGIFLWVGRPSFVNNLLHVNKLFLFRVIHECYSRCMKEMTLKIDQTNRELGKSRCKFAFFKQSFNLLFLWSWQ